MGAFNLKRIVVMLMVVSMSTVLAVGCGDGKGNKRTKTNRTIDAGAKPIVDNKVDTDGDGVLDAPDADGDGKPDEVAATDATDDNLGGDELQQKSADLKKIEDSLKELADGGTSIDKNGLEDGTYKLTSVVSAMRYMFKQEDVRMMQVLELSELGDGKVQLSETSLDKAGVIAEHQVPARALEIALSFEVAKQSGQFAAARTSFSPVVMNTSVTNALQATTALSASSVDASTVSASMIDMLNSAAKGTTDITYSMEDENKRTLIMRLKKISETELRIVVSVEEEKMKDEDANSAHIARDIILTYSFTKKEVAAGSDVVLTQPDGVSTATTTEDAPANPSAQDNGQGDDDLARKIK